MTVLKSNALALAFGLAILPITGCVTTPRVPDSVRSELAPTGKLRAGMNLGNALSEDEGQREIPEA